MCVFACVRYRKVCTSVGRSGQPLGSGREAPCTGPPADPQCLPTLALRMLSQPVCSTSMHHTNAI